MSAHTTLLAARRLALPLALVTAVALLAGCGKKDAGGGEVVAKVNKDDITQGLVNFVVAQQRNLRPDQTDAAARQILDRMVEQQLFVQKAQEQKLDTDPRVQVALELARREVLSRAYLERVGEAAPKPTPEEIKKYFESRPALFAERRIYNLQEIAIEASPGQLQELRDRLGAAKNINEFVEYLKSAGLRFAGNQAVRAAEQLPLNAVDAIAKMKDGQAMVVPNASGAQVVVLAGSRSQPVTLEQATPAIEQQILTERRRKLVDEELKALRTAAKVEYLGKFAGAGTGSSPASPASGAAGGDNKGTATK